MRTTRRSFFKAAALPAVLAAGTRGARTSPVRDSAFDPWVEIRPSLLRHNAAEVARRAGRRILAVVKNNGYGLGTANVARALEPAPEIHGFAVIKLAEAHELRDAGIQKPVLLMGPFDEKDLADMAARDIMPMTYTPIGPQLEKIAAKIQKPVPLHICVDTGIGRVGVPWREAPGLVRDLAVRKTVEIRGTMMTFTEDPEFDREQLRRFLSLCAGLEAEGIALGTKHAASSYGLFQHADAFLDMVRPGMALYGVYPEPEFRGSKLLELRPALALKARVIYVKQLLPGESAGYNRAYMAKERVWVATLPAGHSDGLPRSAAKGAGVRIGGRLYPLVASVSASHCIAEIGTEPRVQAGDVAVFFDDQEGSRPEDFGAASKTSVYDLTMHLSGFLPRRIV